MLRWPAGLLQERQTLRNLVIVHEHLVGTTLVRDEISKACAGTAALNCLDMSPGATTLGPDGLKVTLRTRTNGRMR